MLVEPNCNKRKCKHYLGVIQSDGTEMTETNHCTAYPEHIPVDISYGNDLHLKVRKDQDNETVYEKE
jgi:hypothetical protein